ALPPEHPLAFARSRRTALGEADVVVVVGTPLDFRLHFGDFGSARVVHIVDSPHLRAHHTTPAVSPAGDLRVILYALADCNGRRTYHSDWVAKLRVAEQAAAAQHASEMAADTDPSRPARV